MHEMPKNKEQSVYLLLTSLCRSIATENGHNEYNGLEATVPKLRAEAYEILLKKSPYSTKWSSSAEKVCSDALRELDEHIFATKLDAKSKGLDACELEAQLSLLLSNADSYLTTSDGNNILKLLLALQCNLRDGEENLLTKLPRELLVPGAFTLNASFQNNRYYPHKSMILSRNAEPKYFQSLQKLQANPQKGFVSESFPKSVRNLMKTTTDKNISSKNPIINNEDFDCTFTGMTRRHICSDADWLRIDMRSLQFTVKKSSDFYPVRMTFLSGKQLQPPETTYYQPIQATPKKVENPALEKLIETRRTMSWSWDQMGSTNGVQCAKPFVSDVNIPFELKGLVCQERKQHFHARVLTKEQFLRDLKLLTVGLQSDTFYLNKDMIFCALPDVTIANVLPATMVNYLHEFLECGTCYKRLQMMTSKSHVLSEGFIFKAFCAAVNEYLLTFRQFVFSYKEEETLISFYKRMKRFLTQIQNLSLTLAINPRADPDARLPKGSQFLGYLYREIMRLTDNEYITLLMFFLKRCCHIYFKYLQLWIFHGVLDDSAKELFILYVDHYRKNTKHFYDKGYIVRKEAVPGFFQNYEDRILQCGKYTMLLKAYKANHPLFDLESPKIAVHLSFDEIQKLEASCAKYAEKAREVCGKPVTVKNIFEARAERRNDFQKLVFQRSRENMERWNLEQRTISKNIAEGKRKRFEELTAQLEEAKQYRIEKKRENVEIELKALREAEKLHEERLKKDNINLRKRIEYYQELSDTLKSDASEYDTASSTYSRKTRRHSLSIIDEGNTCTSKTPTSATHSLSTTSLGTYQGNIDADTISTYTECNSKSFESEFAKTADDLHAFLEERRKEYANYNNNNDHKIKRTEILKPEIKTKALQRSISDVINSNVSSERNADTEISNVDNLNELQLNRLKTLTGTIGLCFDTDYTRSLILDNQRKPPEVLRVTFENDVTSKKVFSKAATELELNRQKVLTAGDALRSQLHKDDYRKSLPDVNLNMISKNPLSDLERNRKHMMEGPSLFAKYVDPSLSEKGPETASINLPTDLERNRRKVLTAEYCISLNKDEMHRKSLPDIDIHTLPDDMLSDMQRNRRRMMESPHPFTEYNKPAFSQRPNLNLNLNTDRARNRLKVLESEYNIITGDALSTRDVLTPMSTTSDPPLTEQLSESELKSEKSDKVNGNLKLNISMLTENNNLNQEGTFLQPSTADTQALTTPFDALTSAGVRAKTGEGFTFESASQEESSSLLNLTTDCDEVDSTLEDLLSTSPYQWCKELVESKFKCSTRSSVFRLNINPPKKSPASSKENSLQNFKIDSLSVITLTEFLQKSIIMPMNTHMDLVNGEVMRVLLQDLHLIDHFRSLRNYFFLMDGEFGSIICDGIIGRVESGDLPIKVLSYQMLHMILDTALSCSIQKDSNAENLSFIVSGIPSKFELISPNVLSVLSLSYRVQWPLNLILNPETLEQYGNIFKYLIKVRRISWVLEKAFELLRQAAKQHGKRLLRSSQYLRIQQIRHKFYHFVHALQNHITATALQASWKLFKDELINAKSLEDIYRMHTHYIKRIMFLCMLNRSSVEFNNAIESIFKISLKFYNNLKCRNFIQREGAKEFTHSRFTKMISEEEEFEKLKKYTIYLGNKIVRRGYQAEIGEFITLININKYYTSEDIYERTSKTTKPSDQS